MGAQAQRDRRPGIDTRVPNGGHMTCTANVQPPALRSELWQMAGKWRDVARRDVKSG